MELVQSTPTNSVVGSLLEQIMETSTWVWRFESIWMKMYQDDYLIAAIERKFDRWKVERRQENSRRQERGKRWQNKPGTFGKEQQQLKKPEKIPTTLMQRRNKIFKKKGQEPAKWKIK